MWHKSLYTSIPIDLGLEAILNWLNNKNKLISNHFSQNFILELVKFKFSKSNFKFGEIYYNQTEGSAMGTECATPYVCLIVGYKEETKLSLIKLPKFFQTEETEIVEEVFRRYMNDAYFFLLSLAMLNFNRFKICYIHSLIIHMKKQTLQEMKMYIQFKF